MNPLDGVKLRDPQDTLLLVALIAFAVFVVIEGQEYASEIASAVVAGVLTKVGTTGAQPNG